MTQVNTSTPDPFWLIWTKGGKHNPTKSHSTLEGAQAEAHRLALKYPHQRWFIVQAVERVWVNEAEDRLAPPADPVWERQVQEAVGGITQRFPPFFDPEDGATSDDIALYLEGRGYPVSIAREATSRHVQANDPAATP